MSARLIPAVVFAVLGLITARPALANDLDRADYKLTLPAGSKVESEDKEVDLDHLTTITLPNDNAMVLLVIDDNDASKTAMKAMLDQYKSKLKDAIETKTTTFEKQKPTRSIAVTGRLNGLRYVFDIAQINGKQKAFFIVLAYPQTEKAETVRIVQKSLESFKIKEKE